MQTRNVEHGHRQSKKQILLLVAGALGLVLSGAIAGLVVLFSGSYDTAATRQHFFITHRLFDAGLRSAIGQPRTLMPDLDVPPAHAEAMARYLLARGDSP